MNHFLIVLACSAAALTTTPLHGQTPAPPAQRQPADRAALTSTIDAIATILRETYVYPEVGERMAAHLLDGLEGGQWDYVGNEQMLAQYLTDDLRKISGDKHLGVVHSPQRPSGSGPQPAPRGRDIESMRRDNFAFRKVELLQGNIGYLRFDLFIADDEAKEVASAAMAFLANADALIFDLRRNGGGSPDMIRYITSYFFDEPTLLNIMIDRDGEVVSEYHTLESVPGRRFSPDLPIYILTSSYTFSGAEEFAYNLKHLKRAVIVGETTGGGAHPVRGERVNDQYVVRVRYMRAYNPISGTNWEGTGVKPHIEVSADDALDRALLEARETVLGEKSLREAGWPRTRAGAAAAAFFEAYGDDNAMTQFSKDFRSKSAREGRSDTAYAAFWQEYAQAAVPSFYVSRGERELSVTAYLTHHDGREVEATFRFEFDSDPPHGLRAIYTTTTR